MNIRVSSFCRWLRPADVLVANDEFPFGCLIKGPTTELGIVFSYIPRFGKPSLGVCTAEDGTTRCIPRSDARLLTSKESQSPRVFALMRKFYGRPCSARHENHWGWIVHIGKTPAFQIVIGYEFGEDLSPSLDLAQIRFDEPDDPAFMAL